MSGHLVEVSVVDGIARLILNRPERRNALSLNLLENLQSALTELASSTEARVVVVSGAGVAFSAGHDLSEMVGRDHRFYDDLFSICTEVMLSIQAMPQPVIAQVNGVATAAGCQLVAACDLAVAVETSTFATPGVKIGLFCSTPMVPLSRAIGRKRAMEMLLTGDPIDAARAYEWGLINAIVPEDELDSAVMDLAQRIMRYSSAVIGMGKNTFYEQIQAADRDAYRIAQPVMSTNAQHPDAAEGMRAFLAKRPPDWPSQR